MRRSIVMHLIFILIMVLSACGGSASNGGGSSFPPAPSLNDILINEIDSDSAGVDTLEFIELYNTSSVAVDVSDLVVVGFTGSTDASYFAYDLDGVTIAAGDYYVLGNTAVSNVDYVIANNTIQNGADAIALYEADATDFPNGTLVTTTNLIDAIVYDTSDADDAGLAILLSSGAQLDENENTTKDSVSLQRIPNGSGAARASDAFEIYVPTPGAENAAVAPLLAPTAIN